MNKTRYIYLLKDPISKNVVYVGETTDPRYRYNQHIWGTKSDSDNKVLWLASLKAINLKPLFEIVDTADNKREALIKENALIVQYIKRGNELFNRINNRTVKQYDKNGNLIGEYSDLKMAFDITGITPKLDRYTTYGFQWSYGEFNPLLFIQKENAKKAKCKTVQQIDKSGEIINEFDGVRIASEITSIDHRSISQVASGSNIRKTAGGFIWKYK